MVRVMNAGLKELKTKLSINVNDNDVGTNVNNQDSYLQILDHPLVNYQFLQNEKK